jgi:type IX secretion system PorP/SprF family membrane protein
MKRKITFLFLLMSFIMSGLMAQQDRIITHFIYDKMSLNPGVTGIEKGICASTIYRNQWDKVNGAPNSVVLNVDANAGRFGGVGLTFFHDAIGFSRQNNVLLNYSFPLTIGNAGTLGVGIGVGIVNFGMSPNWVPPTTAVDPTLPVGFSATNLDLNFGLYWKGNSDYYVGLSSTHLNETLLKQTVGNIDQTYQTARHYYLMGGKKFRNITDNGDLDVQVLMRTELVKFSADINVRYLWMDKAYGGLTYRNVDALCLMVGGKPISGLDFTVGYSYDLTTNKLASVSRGSHEIFMKYCYVIPPPPLTRSKHPRWL